METAAAAAGNKGATMVDKALMDDAKKAEEELHQ